MTIPPFETLGDYRIRRELAEGRTYLAESEQGKLIVLKLIDANCLLSDHLHPAVRDRLARLKELADPHVAALLGVERLGGRIFLAWEYVEGIAVDQWLARQPIETVRGAVREVVLAVQSLHARGIVHGALQSGNILIDQRQIVRLIDISPLLHHDPSTDAKAVVQLVDAAIREHAEVQTLRPLLDDARYAVDPLASLRLSLAAGVGAGHLSLDDTVRDDRRRRSALWVAIGFVVLIGVVTSLIAARLGARLSAPVDAVDSVQSRP